VIKCAAAGQSTPPLPYLKEFHPCNLVLVINNILMAERIFKTFKVWIEESGLKINIWF
jgi:hypothetical protein